MALALFLWAVEFLLRYFDQARTEHLYRASLALGLAVAGRNPTPAFPGHRPGLPGRGGAGATPRVERLADQVLLAGFRPRRSARDPSERRPGREFYVGTQSATRRSKAWVVSLVPDLRRWTGPQQPLRDWLYRSGMRLVPAALALYVLVIGWLLWRRRCAQWSPEKLRVRVLRRRPAGQHPACGRGSPGPGRAISDQPHRPRPDPALVLPRLA